MIKDKEKSNEVGKYLLDISKIAFAVFFADNVINSKLVNGLTVAVVGLVMSIALFFAGLSFIKGDKI